MFGPKLGGKLVIWQNVLFAHQNFILRNLNLSLRIVNCEILKKLHELEERDEIVTIHCSARDHADMLYL